ncbi:ATP-NAD/AcoX kinase [Natronococcus amylolyticus DSM 10524]|uniref:ATP-NAD/AcoX kinase n=1 Tax=Natronococcus amylolyticus DSM 10524 TaxID=1227497 RepID=L9XEJ8_9EURY|nr:NAD(+)/NADH kinase [Natronococcus amylolyticus]ELY60165.1 ATP-NAD/AcoX kinase [Natronococcus amylolyticus DSM 10524]
MARVGLVVNPAAGRDIRRLTGGASVVDDYAKRRVADCVLEGVTAVADPPSVRLMPDRSGIADHVLEEAPEALEAETLEMPVENTAADTRRAAARFREGDVGAVVVLGGDGTTRDVASGIGSVPVIAVSTGTNNVVPSAVDGTVAGVAAALVATGAVPAADVVERHGRIEARAETPNGEKRLTALAAAEVSSRSFIGSRALLDPDDLLGGVVSRAHPGDIGLPAVAGALEPVAPDEPGGVAVRLTDPENSPRTARAVLAPGVVATVGIKSCERVDPDEPVGFEVPDGVVGADGERELELTDASVEFRVRSDGPRLVDVDVALTTGADAGAFALEAVDVPPAPED